MLDGVSMFVEKSVCKIVKWCFRTGMLLLGVSFQKLHGRL